LTFPKKNYTNINKQHLEAVHLKIPAQREILRFRMGGSNVFITHAHPCRKNQEYALPDAGMHDSRRCASSGHPVPLITF